jgi:hypothetical protein
MVSTFAGPGKRHLERIASGTRCVAGAVVPRQRKLIEDGRKAIFQVVPVGPDKAKDIIHQAFATPRDVIQNVRQALGR